jgi:hypothetical protein
MKTIIKSVAALLISLAAYAGGDSSSNTGAAGSGSPEAFKDVESLMDNVDKHNNKRVSVKGEVEKSIDGKSFLLDSGGIINDEIVVVKGPGMADSKFKQIKEDKDVTVVGKVRSMPVVELRRELSWDLDPQIEAELQDVKAFIVAEDVK